MAGLSNQESRRRYSWWWDSHISPKNSRWLQENLTGMDGKVKQMIKIIEEDADSFARRAEMYYKRRPELMRLVEEFYRAYRALAERYDHATGVIRHAHKTMVEAFPDQVASLMNGEVDANSQFMSPSVRDFFEPADEMQKDALGLSSPDLPAVKRKGGLNGVNNCANGGLTDFKHSASKHEGDILRLKEALAKLEAEKEAGLLQYEKSLERLSNMEKEIMLAQEDSKKLSERASQAESEVELLRGALVELRAEKELVLFQYQQCLEKISILENQIFHYEHDAKVTNDRANRAENEVQVLKRQLAGLQAEKEAITAQHNQCTETISMIEIKLHQAEDNARRTTERAEMAESKVDNLNLAIMELTEEKEAYAVQCQQYLERISSLEFQILFSQEENQRLNEEISNGVAKLKSAEKHCLSIEYSHQSLQSELDHLIQKMESQNSELNEKQMELGRLWTCVQEERSRFVEAETAFQTLQHLHIESQEEATTLALELENRARMVLDLEAHNLHLQEEISKIKEENRLLNEIHLSSEVSMGDMKDEISTLRATIAKLQEEIETRVNERNALQHEIYRVRVELNDMKQKYGAVLEHVESLELDPHSFASSVKELRDKNTKLNEFYHMEKSDKETLLEKLESMAELLQQNTLLENTIADLNIELQQVKDKVKTLEEACQMLMKEKSAIVAEKNALHSQFQILSENTGVLSKKNVSLENSLADVYAELELLKEKSRILEESLLSVGIEKTRLLSEYENHSLELNNTKQRLKDTEIKVEELEMRNFNLESENKLLVCSIGKLRQLLDTAMQENLDSEKLYQTQLASLECQLQSLHEEAKFTKYLYIEEVDKLVRAEIEISILRTCLQELHDHRSSLRLECLKFFEASQISEMEEKNADQQAELEVLYDALELIRSGVLQMSKTFDFDVGIRSGCNHEDKGSTHFPPQTNQILGILEDIKKALAITLDENQRLVLEKSVLVTLLEQLRLDAADLDSEKYILSQNLKSSAQSLLKLLSEAHILLETNEGLQKTVEEADYREKTLRNDIEELNFILLDVKGSYQTLEQNNNVVLEEKKSLIKEVLELKGAKVALEEEIHEVLGDAVSLNNTFLVFKHFFSEKSMEVKELDESIHQLYCIKIALEEVIRELEEKLEAELTEKSCLIKSMEESKNELKVVRSISNKLKDNIADGEELLNQKKMELSDAKFKLQALLKEQIKLHRSVEDLKGEYDNIKAINRKQAEQIVKLNKENGLKSEENEDLRGSKNSLETALLELRKKHENAKMRELTLKSEVQRWRHKERMYEKEFVELFSTLQISVIQEACYLDKFHDLRKEFESLASQSRSTEAEAQLLKERIRVLEAENAGLKAHFSDYESAVNSLSCSMASLERQPIFHENSSNLDGAKDAGSMSLHQSEEQGDTSSATATLGAGVTKLKNFQSRIEAVELAVEGIQKLASGRSLGSSVIAQASDLHPDDLESGRSLRLHRVMSRRQRHHNSYASTEVTELPKDIMLDQISACSSYGLSRREITPADDHMLELWGTSKESSMNCGDVRVQKLVSSRKEISIPGIVAEMEMAVVDKLEVCKSPKYPQQKRKNVKILERLHFDAQKLENLQKTVQDLRTKIEIAEKNNETTGVLEYDTVKEQLEDAEDAIEKLFVVNERLTQTVEDDSASPKSVTGNGSDGSLIVRRRRVLEQIRRASEKISRLNFEVQKLQFLLQKLEGENKETVKTRLIPRSPRVRLREYLYGGSRPTFAFKQKRRQFCGCIQPPTTGD